MTEGNVIIEKLIAYAKCFLYLDVADEIYTRNRLMRELRVETPAELKYLDLHYIKDLDVPDSILQELREYALSKGLCQPGEEEAFTVAIFGDLTPLPSEINQQFRIIKEMRGVSYACEYLYGISVRNDYVKKTAVGRNIGWDYLDEEGKNRLKITINLSKPEKNNKDIALLLKRNDNPSYPACALCSENEGYQGNEKIPPRGNLRTVSMRLGGDPWFMQYSPYQYYNEHCIVINRAHNPMKIDGKTVTRLLDFVDEIPDYFVGSNAALPIVGGSILNHEHYQGGKCRMPMFDAGIRKKIEFESYPEVEVGILDWYNSAIRLVSHKREGLEILAEKIIAAWENFDDERVGILSHTGETRHNTLSPIARKLEDGRYCLEMIFRNNRTSEEHPGGIFHAHSEYHNIKKESIGLIEAMGLFILPGRLKSELQAIGDVLQTEDGERLLPFQQPDHPLYVHNGMLGRLMETYGRGISKQKSNTVIMEEINQICRNILENTAVFKRDEAGNASFGKFLTSIK